MSRVSDEKLEKWSRGKFNTGMLPDAMSVARELRAAREALDEYGLMHKKGCSFILWADRLNHLKRHERQAWMKVQKECDCGVLEAKAAYDATEDGE